MYVSIQVSKLESIRASLITWQHGTDVVNMFIFLLDSNRKTVLSSKIEPSLDLMEIRKTRYKKGSSVARQINRHRQGLKFIPAYLSVLLTPVWTAL